MELERRNAGKALQKTQQQQKDNELKEWAKNRAKEKEEERLAREKVKALIAQDRLELKLVNVFLGLKKAECLPQI